MTKELQFDVECVLDARCALGESPVWSVRENALYWVDILQARVHRWYPANGERKEWQLPAQVGSIGLRERGGVVVVLKTGFHLLDTDSGALTFLGHPESHLPTNRFNDGKVSPEGRFWAGTMDERADKQPVGALYRLDADHRFHRMAIDLKVSNGLAWSPDGRTMYHSDSRAAAIYRYDYEPDTGTIGKRDLFASMQPEWGRPDGAAVDIEGCYWSAGVTVGRINRFSPGGDLLGYVRLPVTHPTMPCFAGPDLKTLYITTLRAEVPLDVLPSTPLAGGIFKIDVDVAGTPVGMYQG